MEKDLTHLNQKGEAQMVDISEKKISCREAMASGRIKLLPATIQLVTSNQMKKGNVLTTAKIAGIMAAKNTSSTIPLCHPLLLESIDIDFNISQSHIKVTSNVKCTDKTGAEMEALHAVTVTLLTIYDMCKAVDQTMTFEEIKLCRKSKTSV